MFFVFCLLVKFTGTMSDVSDGAQTAVYLPRVHVFLLFFFCVCDANHYCFFSCGSISRELFSSFFALVGLFFWLKVGFIMAGVAAHVAVLS